MTLFQRLLQATSARGASDLHAVVASRPVVRIHGVLTALEEFDVLSRESMQSIVREVLDENALHEFETSKEWGGAVNSNGIRFRVNVFLENSNLSLVARAIQAKIPSPDEIGLQQSALQLVNADRGFVLVTGQTGHGKSTTLASLIQHLNTSVAKNIVTLEDPIEYVFTSARSLVKQREVGRDVNSFAESLKHIVRHDPDVIMVGEMRDPETMKAAITLAETGHLVLSTLHTASAGQTINRIIDSFPHQQQNQIRSQLALSLRGIIAQRLVSGTDGKRVAVREILVNTPAISNLIREDKVEHIESILQTGAADGMTTLDQALGSLYREHKISYDVVSEHAADVSALVH